MEFGNQLCYDLAERIRNLSDLETFILEHTAFDTLGNDASFSDLLCVAAKQAKVSTIVAMSSRDPARCQYLQDSGYCTTILELLFPCRDLLPS